jgi:hypothetical protein
MSHEVDDAVELLNQHLAGLPSQRSTREGDGGHQFQDGGHHKTEGTNFNLSPHLAVLS